MLLEQLWIGRRVTDRQRDSGDDRSSRNNEPRPRRAHPIVGTRRVTSPLFDVNLSIEPIYNHYQNKKSLTHFNIIDLKVFRYGRKYKRFLDRDNLISLFNKIFLL